MPANDWPTKRHSVASLHLDPKNPRLGRETTGRAPREIVQYLFDHDNALKIAETIADSGYFPNEPLLAVKEDGRLVVVEGNRRLAALKALREPGLLEGPLQRKVDALSKRIADPADIARVPVTTAPSRRATDRLIVARHIGTPVKAWEAENRASFILEKLDEGYDNKRIHDELGFSVADIQSARKTRAIADMARSLDLPEEVRAKIDNPRAKIFTTLERVIDSTVGRDHLFLELDPNHGLVGKTTKAEFLKGFRKLVTDIALGHATSRSLNNKESIDQYFNSLDRADRPTKKNGRFVPADVISGRSVASSAATTKPGAQTRRAKQLSKTVIPRDFKVRYGSNRLVDIRRELGKLKREDFPNASAVLLRVFFELSVLDFLERVGRLTPLVKRLEEKERRKLPFGTPTLRQLVPEITKVADDKLRQREASRVKKAVKYDRQAPFTISELHGFVHSDDLPSAREVQVFWERTEPLFRLMLEEDPEEAE